MTQALIATGHITRALGQSSYRTIWGENGSNSSLTYTTADGYTPVSVRGVILHMYVELSGSPGEGHYHYIRLYKNGVATTISVKIENSDTVGRSRSLITVEPGDALYIRTWGDNDVASRYPYIGFMMQFLEDKVTDSPLVSRLSGIGSAYHISLCGLGDSDNLYEERAQMLVVQDATISDLRIKRNNTTGDKTFVFRKNDANTDLQATVPSGSSVGSDTEHSVAVTYGDIINVYCPGGMIAGVSVKVTSYTSNQLLFGGYVKDSSYAGVVYCPAMACAYGMTGGYGTDQPWFKAVSIFGMTLTKFGAHLSSAPGAGKSITISLMSDSDEISLVTLSGTDVDAATDLSEIIAEGKLLRLKVNRSHSTINSEIWFGFSAIVSPAPPTVTTGECTTKSSTELTVSGNITSAGGADTCAVRGFCYKEYDGTDPNVFDDSIAVDGALGTDGEFGTGEYTVDISGLEVGKIYAIRAICSNSSNMAYGDVILCGINLSLYPDDAMARISSIRRIFRPGMYRMELALGYLGFEWDVSELGMRKTDEGVKEPEEEEEPSELPTAAEVEKARQRFQEESWPKAVESLELMTTRPEEWPVVSGRWTPPQPRPRITLINPETGEPLPPVTPTAPKRKFLITYVGGKTSVVEADFDMTKSIIPGIESIKEIK